LLVNGHIAEWASQKLPSTISKSLTSTTLVLH